MFLLFSPNYYNLDYYNLDYYNSDYIILSPMRANFNGEDLKFLVVGEAHPPAVLGDDAVRDGKAEARAHAAGAALIRHLKRLEKAVDVLLVVNDRLVADLESSMRRVYVDGSALRSIFDRVADQVVYHDAQELGITVKEALAPEI